MPGLHEIFRRGDVELSEQEVSIHSYLLFQDAQHKKGLYPRRRWSLSITIESPFLEPYASIRCFHNGTNSGEIAIVTPGFDISYYVITEGRVHQTIRNSRDSIKRVKRLLGRASNH